MANNRLTPSMIAREICCLVAALPWQLKGPDAWHGSALVYVDSQHFFSLRLDDFRDRYLSPALITLLQGKRPACKDLMEMPYYRDAAREVLGDCKIRVAIGDYEKCVQMIHIDIEYTPSLPARHMPVLFWLGEQAEFLSQ